MTMMQLALQRAHLVCTPWLFKVHMSMMAQKNRNIKLQKRIQNFFRKNFLGPKFSKTLYFLAIFDQKFNKFSEPAELDRCRDACNSAKLPQINLFEMSEKIFKNFPPKNSKIDFLGPKWQKKSKIFRKKNFGRNRFRMVQNVFQQQVIDFENFFPNKFFSGS